jgi:hypothetical protein
VQVITIRELLAGKRPKLPPLKLPYIQATRAERPSTQATLDEAAGTDQLGFEDMEADDDSDDSE